MKVTNEPTREAPRACRWVAVTAEMVEQLRDWSDPVQVKITADDGETLELTFRRAGEAPLFGLPVIENPALDRLADSIDLTG